MNKTISLAVGLLLSNMAAAAPTFVNGLTLAGDMPDLSGGSNFDRRVGYFSDLYYDANRNEWWGLSDRGPGGGTLSYETRLQRFTLGVNSSTGAISNFQIAQTIKFSNAGSPMNGLAPNPANTLGNALDPEGFVVNPKTGHFLVSDEYGPSLNEFDRNGNLVRQYTIPANLVPKVGANIDYTSTVPTLTSGREPNRGFEGLAISPDGNFAYAVLQNGTIQDRTTSSRGQFTRIVKFDTSTGEAVGQYAYRLDRNGQGQGISALVALGNDKFLILERNNRGIGVDADLATADKSVYEIDLANATDVSNIDLPSAPNATFAGAVAKSASKFLDLDANTLAALGNKSPEKWEGLTIGPKLDDGGYLILAGTDNDYSVTQNGTGTQFDVWFDFTKANPYAESIQCPVGSTLNCFLTTGGAPASLTNSFALLPGVLHAYKASGADLAGYVAPVPVPAALWLFGGALAPLVLRARRGQTA